MSGSGTELRRVSWIDVFPFIRLFHTSRRAMSFGPLVLGLLSVLSCYLVGRGLDAVWTSAGAGVLVEYDVGVRPGRGSGPIVERILESPRSEIQIYATKSAARYSSWYQSNAQFERERTAERNRLITPEFPGKVAAALALIDTRLAAGLAAIDSKTDLPPETRESKRLELRKAADVLRFSLHRLPSRHVSTLSPEFAADILIDSDGVIPAEQRRAELDDLVKLLRDSDEIRRIDASRPRGPFAAFLDYQMDCFAGAIQGVSVGRLGLGDGPFAMEPSMLGSVGASIRGVAWMATQRPFYAFVFGILALLIFAIFGGAICRCAAIESARDKTASVSSALRFSREKLPALAGGALLLPGIFLLAWAAMFISGVIGGILPWGIGALLAGLLYFLAIIGGVALAFALIGMMFGFHLMWPAVAVEGSDSFDAVQRGAGYVFQRPWCAAFYSFLLLVYGAFAFLVIRGIAMLLLKLTHAASDAGLSVAGALSSARTDTLTPLGAMWHMPAWQELSFVPTVGDVPFWGQFGIAPLSTGESIGAFFIAIWVFLAVAVVGGFAVSYFFCGSTTMYTLLRRDVDGVDFDDIFYEGDDEDELNYLKVDDEPPADAGAGGPAAKGTPLPIVSAPSGGTGL